MKVKITLNDIGGYEYQKEEANKIINFFNNYEEFTKNGAKLPRGIIFYGRPGTGKTMFANAIADSAKNAKLFSLTDKEFYNETNLSLSIHNIFKKASANAPSIILIDELDQLVSYESFGGEKMSDKQREVLRSLLTEIDNLSNEGVFVIATSNSSLRAIPPALTRNGRIEKHVSIPAPDFDDREKIIDIYLKQSEIFKNIKSKELAKLTQGFTGSALSSLINDVLIKCLSIKKAKAQYDDFYDPIQTIVSHGIKKKPKKNNDDVIYHEIGHLITNYVLNGEIGIINTESYGESEGRFFRAVKYNEDSNSLSTLEDYKNAAIVSIAGLAATEKFLHKKHSGSSSDFSNIRILFTDAMSDGLLPTKYTAEYLIVQSEGFGPGNQSKEYITYFQHFIDDAYNKATEIITSNTKVCEKFFKLLKDKRYLSTEEVKSVLDKENIKPSKTYFSK